MNPSDAFMPKTKKCTDCWAILPITSYGRYKVSKDGLAHICRDCILERKRFDYAKRYGRSIHSSLDGEAVRCVRKHNLTTLEQALSQPTFNCIGFIPHSDKVFRIAFGKSRYDMPSMAIFSEDGGMYEELVWSSNSEDTQAKCFELLRTCGIRLELSHGHMMASKNVIYYLK